MIIYGGVLVHRYDKPTYIWIRINDILVRLIPIYFFYNVQPPRYIEYIWNLKPIYFFHKIQTKSYCEYMDKD